MAVPCVGVISTKAERAVAITVDLTKGSKRIASEVVKGRHTFHFAVGAGHYLLTEHFQSGVAPTKVVVHPGTTTRITVNPKCK
jgi:hypothetical protein